MKNTNWELLSTIVEIKSQWLTVIGEKIKDNQDNILDYWRVEKDDSLIIITKYKNSLIFPKLTFRPGIKQVTLDLAGGRVDKNDSLENTAYKILKRELNLNPDQIDFLTPINKEGLIINSSFNNQKLWGFYGELNTNINLDNLFIGAIYSLDKSDFQRLLKDLNCIQCRVLLFECIYQELIVIF